MRALIRLQGDVNVLVYVSKMYFHEACLNVITCDDKDSTITIPMDKNSAEIYEHTCLVRGYVDLTKYMAEIPLFAGYGMNVF